MKKIIGTIVIASILSGCASYRVFSNIPPSKKSAADNYAPVQLVAGELAGRHYKELGPIEVTVNKGNPFVAAPTKKQADSALIQKSRDMGADAVIKINYETGFDVFTWGYIKATGIGITFAE